MAESPDDGYFICTGCDVPLNRRECPFHVVVGDFRFHSLECQRRWLDEGQEGMS